MSRHVKVFLASVFALVMTVLSTASASAYYPDNLIPTGSYSVHCYNTYDTSSSQQPCQTDNGAISVFMQSSVTSDMRSRIHDSLDNSYDPIAELSVTYVTTPVYTGVVTETDIIYQQSSPMPDGAAGMYWCKDAVDGAAYGCDQGYVRLDANPIAERRSLVCHETGHAVGLMHGENASPMVSNQDSRLGCMTAPFNVNAYVLGPNNVQQIKDTY